MPPKKSARDYDVCLSFAGENRRYVSAVAAHLRSAGVRVFYDDFDRVKLWGKDLYEHLDDVYKNSATYCVLFISRYYAKKLWTNHERRSAQERAFRENDEYILPARFDSTELPGIRETVGYIDLKKLSSRKFADLIINKIGTLTRSYYVPPVPNRLYSKLGVRTAAAKNYVFQQATEFVEALERMSETERRVLMNLFIYGCPSALPDNMHIDGDLLRRFSNLPISACVRELGRLSSLGFRTKVSRRRHDAEDPKIAVSFHVGKVSYDGPDDATGTIDAMINCLTEDYCPGCAFKAAMHGDFSALATATQRPERHGQTLKKKAATA